MNKSGQNHLAVGDKTGKLIKASIAPSTVETCRYAMQ